MSERRSSSLLQRQQIWVLAVGALFLADFVLYGYLPSRSRLRFVTEARDRQMQMIHMAESRSEVLGSLKARLEQTNRRVANYQDRIPDDSALGPFLRQVAGAMTKNGLLDQDVVFGREVASNGLVCIPVHMKCSGDLAGVFGFFTDLQNLGRFVRIERTTLANAREFTGAVVMEADAVIFYRPQKAPETKRSASTQSWDVVHDDA